MKTCKIKLREKYTMNGHRKGIQRNNSLLKNTIIPLQSKYD